MVLYHGSNMDIKVIDLAMCRPYKDLGREFYLTVMKDQAEKMAKEKQMIEYMVQDLVEINGGHLIGSGIKLYS